jgi:flavin reductase (DIM6/NTAB) family NADH-FMN oxidoreductase RutF
MTMMYMQPLADRVRAAMRRTASSVAVLATDGPAGRAGVTISTLCSLSLEPPSVIACVHRDSRALGPVLANGAFSANILAEGQSDVATAFAGLDPHYRDNRFAAGSWHVADGLPRLEGAVASFACRIAVTHEFGTHLILIGEIEDVRETDNPPLIYADRTFQRLTAA